MSEPKSIVFVNKVVEMIHISKNKYVTKRLELYDTDNNLIQIANAFNTVYDLDDTQNRYIETGREIE